jgi:cell wall integrity and stress response component
MWWITLTGITKNRIEHYEPESSSSSSSVTSKTSSTPAAAKTSVEETVLVTASATGTPKKSSGPNTTGIAVGVVVGVLVLAAIIGGVLLYLRRVRRHQVEEDYRRQAAMNPFTAGGKPHTSNSSMTDSRLDPEFMNRRASNGSIADNEDYSRRILKV